MVQNRGDIGLDKVVMKVKDKEGKEKRRTVCLKKPNLIRPLSQNNTPRHKSHLPRKKAEITSEKRRESDGLGER